MMSRTDLSRYFSEGPQVAARHPDQIVDILLAQRLVHAVLGQDVGLDFGAQLAVHVEGTAWGGAHHEERGSDHQEQGGYRHQQASAYEAEHRGWRPLVLERV